MKAARRPRVPLRSAVPATTEALDRRLARVEDKLGAFQAETFIQFEGEAPKNCSPNGRSAPIAGDTLIWFKSLQDQGEEKLTPEEYRAKHCRQDIRLPLNVTLPTKPLLRDPDPELRALAEEQKAPDLRPLTEDEMHQAMSGLLATGNLLGRRVVREALTGRQVPLGDDEEFPRAEFASSTSGTLLIRVWNHRGEQPKPRPATESDKTTWPATFDKFIAACLAHRNNDEGNAENSRSPPRHPAVLGARGPRASEPHRPVQHPSPLEPTRLAAPPDPPAPPTAIPKLPRPQQDTPGPKPPKAPRAKKVK